MNLWDNFLFLLDDKFGKKSVDKWLRTLKVVRFDACNLYLEAEDSFQAIWVEEHVLPFAAKNFKNNNGHAIKIHVASPDRKKESEPDQLPAVNLTFQSDTLSPHATFEQYVPTTANQMPFQIFCKLAGFNSKTGTYEAPPAEKFNPIYLYGPAGSGKTHLLMAAASFMQLRGLKVLFVKAETFTEHVVNAIRSGNMQLFRQAYRGIDALLIDNVQVFARKNATQEELFHTFNTLHTAGKQIILSSNVNPRLLEYLEDRLISRFEWGITLPLEKPTESAILPTILEKRLNLYHLKVKKPLSDFLLKNFHTPASLSRAIEQLIENHGHPNQPIELEFVEPLLSRLIDHDNKNSINPDKILEAVASAFGIKKEDILSKSQSRDTTLPRQISMYLLRQQLNLPYMKIGDIFHRDHSTVMSGIKQITKGLETQDSDITYYLNQLRTLW